MPLMNIGDAELYFEEFGSGPNVVLSCASGFTAGTYPELLASAPTDCRVITIQARGFGQSTHQAAPAQGWLDQWADDVCAFADRLGLEKFIYTGISHGGGIGWHIARRNPERLRALISVVGTPHDRDGGVDSSEGRRKIVEGRRNPEVIAEQLRIMAGKTDDPARAAWREEYIEQRIAMMMTWPEDEATINQGKPFPDATTDEELEKVFESIHVPVLILGALRDGVISPESCLRAARHVRGAKAVLFEDEGHWIGRESPARLVREVAVFLDELRLAENSTPTLTGDVPEERPAAASAPAGH
jgi:pimeloyl-ACP methyl ester carboxylesterase